jgi:DUF1009 family protein
MTRRLTIMAGAGALVPEVISRAKAAGDAVQVLPLVDRSDLGLSETFGAADMPGLISRIAAFGSTHMTMVGGIYISNTDREAMRRLAGVAGTGPVGDATLFRLVTEELFAMPGVTVIGPETIAPEIIAGGGLLAGPAAPPFLLPVMEFALRISRAIGALEIGQAVVVAPERVIAVEDIAGTDDLLARVARYRSQSVGMNTSLILAKALMPHQTRRVDRPAIGPTTVRNAALAGIAAIVVEAGGAIVVDRAGVAAAALETGISVVGLEIDAA